MPMPISNDSTPYLPSGSADLDGCDPNLMSCAPEANTSPPAASVTLDPIWITGDPGTRELVARHDAAQESPDCSTEARAAVQSCAGMMPAALGGVLMCSTGLGAAAGITTALMAGANCGKDLALLDNCERGL